MFAALTGAALPSDYDLSFGTGGRVVSGRLGANSAAPVVRQYPHVLAINSQARAVVVGACDGRPAICIARYLADGDVDDTFGVHGLVALSRPNALLEASTMEAALHTDDKVSVVGTCREAPQSASGFCSALLNVDGSLNVEFGSNGIVVANADAGLGADTVAAVAVQPDGKVLAAAQCPTANGLRICLVRFLKNGQADSSFGRGGLVNSALAATFYAVALSSLAVQSDGKVVLAANCSH